MNLDKAIQLHKEHKLDFAELVGGPHDGDLAIVLSQNCDSYNGEVYKRSFRVSSQHYEFYCYDYVGHWDDPEVMKILKDSWDGWNHIKDEDS